MSNTRTVIVDGETFEVTIEGDGPTYQVEVGGHLRGRSAQRRPRTEATRRRRRQEEALRHRVGQHSGKVVTVEVTEGQHVEEGQVILILEAMKMQNEIKPRSRVP